MNRRPFLRCVSILVAIPLTGVAADPGVNCDLLHWGSFNKLTPAQKQAHAELDGKLHAWMESINDPLLRKP